MREKILGSQDQSGRRYRRAGLTDRRRWVRNASSVGRIYTSCSPLSSVCHAEELEPSVYAAANM